MKITFLGTTSDAGNCPSLAETDQDTFLVQGNRVTDPEKLAVFEGRGNGIPDYETVVEIPKGLAQYFPRQA